MADEFAVVVLDAPTVTGDQDFTAAGISDFAGAVVLISGDYQNEDASAQLSLALFSTDNAAATSHGQDATFYRAGQNGTTFSRHQPTTSSAGAGVVRVLDPATNGGVWAIGTVSDLANGFRVNWTDVSGLSSGTRKVKLVAILFGGAALKAGSANGNTDFMGPGGSCEQILAFSKRSSFGGTNADLSISLGGAIDGSPIVQGSVGVNFPSGADPSTAGAFASTSEFNAYVNASVGVPTAIVGDAVTDFVGEGFTKDGSTAGSFWLGFLWGDDRHPLLAIEELDGTESGVVTLTGLGGWPELVIGAFVGATASDSLETGPECQVFGLFVAHASGVHSISCAIEEGLDPDVTPTVGFSRYKANEWNVIDGDGTTAFRATSISLVPTGVEIDVQTARAGRLLLWGVSIVDPITPAPVALGLEAAAPAVLIENQQLPAPVPLGISAPAPLVVLPRRPDPVELALSVVSPSIIAPLPPEPVDPEAPVLAEVYARGLRDLLPRGLAWTRLEETVVGRLLRAFAETCERLELRSLELLREADPRLTLELLAEWEALLRTRIDCPDLGASLIERRFSVVARLTIPGGQNRYHYAQVAQALGYDVGVEDFEELSPFQVEIDTVETALYGEEWRFVVVVHAPEITPTYFRAGLSQAGDPLVTATNERLECELDRLKPAHVLFLYAYDRPFEGYAPWNVHAPDPIPLGIVAGGPSVLF